MSEELAFWSIGMERAAAICQKRAKDLRPDDPVEAEHKMEAMMCASEIMREVSERLTASVEAIE